MVESVEIEDQAHCACESIEGTEEASNVAQVVKEAVDDALQVDAITTQLEDYTAWNCIYIVVSVGWWRDDSLHEREYVLIFFQQESNGPKRVAEVQMLYLDADWVLNLCVPKKIVSSNSWCLLDWLVVVVLLETFFVRQRLDSLVLDPFIDFLRGPARACVPGLITRLKENAKFAHDLAWLLAYG